MIERYFEIMGLWTLGGVGVLALIVIFRVVHNDD
jgi:hypothetical protein